MQEFFIAAAAGGQHLDPAEIVDIDHGHGNAEGLGHRLAEGLGLQGPQHDRLVVGGGGAGHIVDQAGLISSQPVEPTLAAHDLQGRAHQPGNQHLGWPHHIDQRLKPAGRGQAAGGMEHPAELASQERGFNVGGMVVAALNHRQRGFANGEHIAWADQATGVALQHLLGVIEHAEQVGA